MKRSLSLSIVFFLSLVGCTLDNQQTTSDENNMIPNQQENDELEVVAENLEAPWSIEKINDTYYLTERAGSIVKVENEEAERQSLELEEEISTASEAGLLGFVLAPEFEDSNEAYAYYTYEENSEQFNRIVTLQLQEDVWIEESVVLDNIPSGSVHHGGRIKIGPDEKLYATTGDAAEPEIAQDFSSLGGNILRLELDGSIPNNNPVSDSPVFSYGHRNPQGITWSTDDTLYSSEHGATANDEINLIESGQNYGWPIIEGDEEEEGLISPLFTSGSEETWAPSGMDYYDNKLYVAALRGNAVLEFDLETGEERELLTELGRVRDVFIEDEYLYFISNNTDGRGNPDENDDRLYRVSLSGLSD